MSVSHLNIMDSKGVSPTISVILLLGLSIGLFSLTAIQFVELGDVDTKYSESAAELKKIQGSNGVKARLTQKRGEVEIYLETPSVTEKFSNIGEVKKKIDGPGTYRVVAVASDGDEQPLDTITID